jgi:PAS domain S-box-containing protein
LQLRAIGSTDLAAVACLRMSLYTTDRPDRAVAVGVEQLRTFGIEWSAHPSEEEVRAEYEALRQRVGDRPIETLVDLASTREPDLLALMEVLRAIISPALYTERKLHDLAILRMANLSLEHGHCDASPLAFAQLSLAIGPRFGHYGDGFRFGHLGAALVEREDLARFRGKVYSVVGYHVLPWTHPMQAAFSMKQRALELAQETGDLLFVAFDQAHLISLGLASGARLDELEVEAERYLQSTRQLRFGLVIDIITTQLALIRTLRGLTSKFGYLDDVHAELRMEHHLSSDPPLAIAAWRYWIRKMQGRYLAGDYAAALDASSEARLLLGISPQHWEAAEFYFYSALSHAASWDLAPPDQKQQHFEPLKAHHNQHDIWAQNCPENFETRAALVASEIARIEGRDLDAMHLYEQAIGSARANGFIHNEALAYELAARFYAARGFKQIADLYLRSARYGYLRWGAVGKVRQLDETYPDIRQEDSLPGPTSTIGAPVEHLDLATVIKASQAVSGEIVLGNLIKTLLRIAIEHAGAERGLLILFKGDEPQIAAEATTARGQVEVTLRQTAVSPADLPESALHYVIRTRESVIVADSSTQNPFPADEYICQKHPRSILFLPLVKQAKLIGVLYLDNNLASHVFTPCRISVLELLASQAAISLENARLYNDLQEREARIRRLVDANIIGIFIFRREGRIVEANHAFLKMVGYDREDLVAGRVSFTDLTPPEWRDRTAIAGAEIEVTGAVQPFEKEYFRKDGSRVPVLIGSAAFDEQRDQGVAFVLDLTERKRAEEAFREVQMQLAHANRVATMGQLSASITHEVKQPIGAAIADAQAALHFLARRPPELEEVREALEAIVETGHRAGEIVDRIRGLIKKAPPRKECLDINAGIREVIELTRGESVKNGISLQADLADGLPLIEGDRVQLQQVILNLIVNALEAMSGASDGTRELLVSSRKADPGGVIVEVRDSGPGLAPEALEHVFDAFYTTKPSGLGMGLSICRSIIEAHDGRLWASANPPRGASFQFALPAIANTAS